MRPVDADALYTATYDMACQCVLVPGCEDYAFGLREAADYIEKAQTLDVAPVRHGKWVLVGADKRGRGGIWVCRGRDGCGRSYPYKCNYCPNCGAKMDAGQEGENDG